MTRVRPRRLKPWFHKPMLLIFVFELLTMSHVIVNVLCHCPFLRATNVHMTFVCQYYSDIDAFYMPMPVSMFPSLLC